MELTVFLPYIQYYLAFAVIFWLTTAIVSGFYGSEPGKSEFFASLLWPISMGTVIGTLARVIVEIIKERATKPKKKK